MPIRIPCPSCRANLKLADRLAGKAIKCPKCASVVRVPAAPAPTAPEDAPVDVLEEVDEDAAYGVKENEEVPRRHAKAVGRGLCLDDAPGRLRRWVEEELSRREWLLWAGRPNGWLVVGRGVPVLLVLLFFLSLFGCGGLCFVALGLNPKGAGMMSGGVIIKGVGVAALALMFVGMALWHLWRVYLQTRAGYALTDRRAIIWSVAWNGRVEVESYEPARLESTHRQDSRLRPGAGDLIFRTKTVTTVREGKYGGATTSTTHYGFLAIDEVARVERLLRVALVEPHQGRPED